jgi:hypothetical protein
MPLSNGFLVILMVIDRFTKYRHFIPLAHPYIASKVAQLFLANIFKLHGMPTTIVWDRDPTFPFKSSFWRELFNLQGISLAFSSAYHPNLDGQTEALNKCLEPYLRCYMGAKPNLKPGACGFCWLSGRTTHPTILPQGLPHLKLSMAIHLRHSFPTFQALQPTWPWTPCYGIALLCFPY